jgi:hypothetical protein
MVFVLFFFFLLTETICYVIAVTISGVLLRIQLVAKKTGKGKFS